MVENHINGGKFAFTIPSQVACGKGPDLKIDEILQNS